ncbi:GTP pyrophosphokinase [Fusibacter sp. JL298sf-3]
MYRTLISEDTKPWRELLMLHKFALDEMLTRLNILDEEFRNNHDYNPIEHIRYRIKKQNKIINKLDRLGFDPSPENAKAHIFDIAGIRIICAFQADIYSVLELIKSHKDIKIIQIKDYIKMPKPNGYKSLHVHIEVPVYLSQGCIPVRVEIQLRTIAMDFWASVEHKLYYRYQKKAPPYMQSELKHCADLISELDNRMYRLKQEIQKLDARKEVIAKEEPYLSPLVKQLES